MYNLSPDPLNEMLKECLLKHDFDSSTIILEKVLRNPNSSSSQLLEVLNFVLGNEGFATAVLRHEVTFYSLV